MGLLLKCEHVGFGYENQDAVLDAVSYTHLTLPTTERV